VCFSDAQHEMIRIVDSSVIRCPTPVFNVRGGDKSIELIGGGTEADLANKRGVIRSIVVVVLTVSVTVARLLLLDPFVEYPRSLSFISAMRVSSTHQSTEFPIVQSSFEQRLLPRLGTPNLPTPLSFWSRLTSAI
jgi:hypothetical protein